MNNADETKPSPAPQHPYDIYVVGTGIIPAFHLTREAENAMRQSREILYVDRSFGIEEVLKQYGAKLTDLYSVTYTEGGDRFDAYREMASRVIQAAIHNPPVTLALYGHPLIYCFPPFLVDAGASMLDLKVKIIPGISSLDTLFIDLKIDPCTQGIQMYEATDLLLRRRPIQPDVPCVIWQIGSVETQLFTLKGNSPKRFERIKKYLGKFYPDDTPMFAVYCTSMPLVPSNIIEFTLGTIDDVALDLHQGVTVYIPPLEFRAVKDEEILKAMDSTTYLEELTGKATA
jgi:uncharacterized protein YabN with tetrapyrrole methylase and pyrophosphatase domain